eukprot:5494160-Amphidinium_carterae.1
MMTTSWEMKSAPCAHAVRNNRSAMGNFRATLVNVSTVVGHWRAHHSPSWRAYARVPTIACAMYRFRLVQRHLLDLTTSTT